MDELVTGIQNLYKDYIKDNPESSMGCIKKVYWGDPIKVAAENMPCIYIEPVSTPFEIGVSQVTKQFGIKIGYIEAIKDHLDDEDGDTVFVKKRTVRVVEGVDGTTCNMHPDTLISVLYNSLCGGLPNGEGGVINVADDMNNIVTEYEITQERGILAYEGSFTVTVTGVGALY